MKAFLYVFFTFHVIISCTLIVNYEAEITNNVAPSETPDIENLSTVTQSNDLLENEPTPISGGTIEPTISNLNLSSDKNQAENISTSISSTTNRSLSNDTPVVLSDSLNSEPEKIAEPVPVITLSDEVPQKVVTQSKTEVKVDNGTQDAKKEVDSANAVNENITGGKAEEIPSFSEWAQKRLEEVEKNEQNTSVKGHTTNGIKIASTGARLRRSERVLRSKLLFFIIHEKLYFRLK
ncbi:unnamed protein product [Acanthoscelides obtectus]|uniref:Uncharacterized protein n=1 Tax=Acanthoscelides obtectus TaxID=200917 RepID=A0A9P0M757_ACAOB|nr:unnamed protein product [Acanthoscelides obtectus]CAK1673251.1 hypothetical protein AOBTE_LOCUS29276 [Acanthoscelides obtectus]